MTAPGGFMSRIRSTLEQKRAQQQAANPTFSGAQTSLTRQALGATRQAGELGTAAESEFFRRALAFDPQAAAETSAQGIVSGLTPQLEENLEFARGQAVGGGRLDTGFFDVDRGRIFEDFNQRVASAVAANALQAAGLQQRGIESIGAFGQNVQNRFVNLLGGSLDRATAERNAQKEGGGLFGKILGGAAGLIGGPILGKAGEFVGNKIFPGG